VNVKLFSFSPFSRVFSIAWEFLSNLGIFRICTYYNITCQNVRVGPLPLSQLFNFSLSSSTIPHQWKQAWIRPIPKVFVPTQLADFRPISVTPVLTRIIERTVVQDFSYPTSDNSPESLTFHDQFAFGPTGSTTAAIITLFHNITHPLLTNPYVIVIALDFSKAFDTVRHHTLLAKMAQLDIPDHVYNWLVNFFDVHSHQTKYADDMSTIKSISASIIQGSAIGPASLGLCCKRIWFTSSHQWQPSV